MAKKKVWIINQRLSVSWSLHRGQWTIAIPLTISGDISFVWVFVGPITFVWLRR